MKEIDIDNKDIENLPKEKDKVIEKTINAFDFDMNEYEFSCEEDITDKELAYLERQIRGSYEYKSYIEYLKNELDLNQCKLLPQLDLLENNIGVEMHHYPFTLYDITYIITKHLIKEAEKKGNETVTSFDIEEQVMKEHYENNIGLIPLTSTLHQMAHSKAIIIPIDYVNGNYGKFIEKYKDEIDDETTERLNEALNASMSSDAKELNDLKLSKKIVHFNVKYNEETKNDTDDPDDMFDYDFKL